MAPWRWSKAAAWYVLPVFVVSVAGCSGGGNAGGDGIAAPQIPSNVIKNLQAYLKASNTERSDLFGGQVALSGDTLAVGAWHESSCATGINGDQNNNNCEFAGAVYVFVRNEEDMWLQQAYIKASNTGFFHKFGIALALSGDTLVVGAPDENGCATGVNGNQQQTGCNGSGAVYVFTRAEGVWSQEAYVKPSHTDPQVFGGGFGGSVALWGNTLAVGAHNEASCATGINGDQTNMGCPTAGAVYVFTRSSSGWTQQAYVKAPNTEASDRFGTSVALSEDSLAVGALFEASCAVGVNDDLLNNGCFGAGAVYVLRRSLGNWSHEAYVKASNTEFFDQFGSAVALSNDTLAVTAAGEDSCATGINGDQANNACDNPAGTGAVYIFTRSASGWVQQAYVKASNTDPGDRFGVGLALLGDILAVGAPAEGSCATGVDGDQSNNSCGSPPDTGSDSRAGAVYFFIRSAGVWSQQAYVKASNTGPNDRFGISVALDERTLAVGADLEASCARGINGDQQNDACSGAGAAYVYRSKIPK
ncbi:MAG TPA: hypothetical protein VJL88_02030 [Nitrospira sp.]|nr:hypothetical protein [Nitrospira sp.]